MSRPLSAAALRYAADGWPVFVLGRTKRPVRNCRACHEANPATHDPQACACLTCHGFYAATRDPMAIRRMLAMVPYGMLAVRTGIPSGLVVVDVDPDAGGMDSLSELIRGGLTPPTRYVVTGSGGLHLYYRHPGPQARIPISASKLAPGIDIRADGGLAVLPPSIHPATGRPYRWADRSARIQEMSPALRAALYALTTPPHPRPIPSPADPTSPHGRPRSGGDISYPDRLMASLLARIEQAPQGRHRVTLYGCARGVARIVAAGHLTSTDAYHQLVAACDRVGWQWSKATPNAIRDGFAAEGVLISL